MAGDDKTCDHSTAAIDEAILKLVRRRGVGSSCCPSEVARALEPVAWRPLMQAVRQRAVVLAGRGHILITQGGEPVSAQRASELSGPIRLSVAD